MIGLAAVVAGCDELTVEDLRGAEVALFSPGDGATSRVQTVAFAWEPVAGATAYELSVVSPDFASVGALVAREVTAETAVDVTLPAGEFAWRVEAYNSLYAAASDARALVVDLDSAAGASGLKVALLTPDADAVVNDSVVALLWSGLELADAYEVQVASPGFANSTFLVLDTVVADDGIAVAIAAEGEYRWRVRPLRGGEPGLYAERAFTIDRTAPAAPTPAEPTDGATVEPPVTLRWSGAPAVDGYRVEVRADSTRGRVVVDDRVTTASYTAADTSARTYHWRVSASDAVGNESAPSAWRAYNLPPR